MAPAGRVIRNADRVVGLACSPSNLDIPLFCKSTDLMRRFLVFAFLGTSLGVLVSLVASPLDVNGLVARNDKALNKILVAAEKKNAANVVRLATYYVDAPALQPRNIPILRDEILPRPENKETNIPSRPYILSRSVQLKVHSVIQKYAPKHKSPAQLASAIVQESARQGVDPLFVAAVIKSESAFNTSARSNKGAQGLMQIMPATGAWLVARNDLPRKKLTDPGHNLRLGISYLKYLEESYSGNRVFALVAYNWGPGHVERATGGRKRIPKECMKYALKIIQDYRRWSLGSI
jgi:soluble lytic murein transglycosylase-like protein